METLCRLTTIAVVYLMTNQLHDLLIHLLSDDSLSGIPNIGELPDSKERDLILSFIEKK